MFEFISKREFYEIHVVTLNDSVIAEVELRWEKSNKQKSNLKFCRSSDISNISGYHDSAYATFVATRW